MESRNALESFNILSVPGVELWSSNWEPLKIEEYRCNITTCSLESFTGHGLQGMLGGENCPGGCCSNEYCSVVSNSWQTQWTSACLFPCPSLSEFAQTHVQWVCDGIQPSHPLSYPSLLPSIFPRIRDISNELPLSIRYPKYWSFSFSISPSNIQGLFPLRLTGLISLQSKGLAGVLSNTTVQKHQFFSTQPFLWSRSHIHTWLLETPYLQLYVPLLAKWCLWFLICCLGSS